MTTKEMLDLQMEYGSQMKIDKAVHLHDEDSCNEYCISYKGIIVGSELVSIDFVRNYIEQYKCYMND